MMRFFLSSSFFFNFFCSLPISIIIFFKYSFSLPLLKRSHLPFLSHFLFSPSPFLFDKSLLFYIIFLTSTTQVFFISPSLLYLCVFYRSYSSPSCYCLSSSLSVLIVFLNSLLSLSFMKHFSHYFSHYLPYNFFNFC